MWLDRRVAGSYRVKVRRRTLHGCFHSWRHHRRDEARRRNVNAKAKRHHDVRAKAIAMRAWAAEAAAARRRWVALARFRKRLERKRMARGLMAWRAASHFAVQLPGMVTEMHSRRVKRRGKQACFFAWRRQARATAANVIAAGGYRDGYHARAVRRWRSRRQDMGARGGSFVRQEAEGERGAIRHGAALQRVSPQDGRQRVPRHLGAAEAPGPFPRVRRVGVRGVRHEPAAGASRRHAPQQARAVRLERLVRGDDGLEAECNRGGAKGRRDSRFRDRPRPKAHREGVRGVGDVRYRRDAPRAVRQEDARRAAGASCPVGMVRARRGGGGVSNGADQSPPSAASSSRVARPLALGASSRLPSRALRSAVRWVAARVASRGFESACVAGSTSSAAGLRSSGERRITRARRLDGARRWRSRFGAR